MVKFKFLILLVMFTAISFYVVSQLSLPLTGIDDANIFFVYARNLAHGYGIVFFPNTQPVEGITSLLWLFFITPAFILNKKPELMIVILNIVVLSGGLAFFLDSLDRAYGNLRSIFTIYSFFAVLWTFSSPTYIMWSILSLMDVGLTSTILLITAALLLRIYIHPDNHLPPFLRYASFANLFIIGWVRPEGFIWGGIFLLLLLVRDWYVQRNFQEFIARNWANITTWLLSIIVITIFRLVYFGFPLPNTYYAKVAPSLSYNFDQGMIYFKSYLSSSWLNMINLLLLVIVCVTISILFGIGFKKQQGKIGTIAMMPVLILILVSMTLPILSGGDHFLYFRFYQPIWPLLVLPLVWIFRAGKHIFLTKFNRLYAVVIVILLPCIFMTVWPNWISFKNADHISWEYQVTLLGRSWGQALNKIFVTSTLTPRVGEIAVGGLSYEYKGEIFDLMGLNNVEMAHSAGDRHGYKNHAAFSKSVFYQQEPDLLLPRLYNQNVKPADFSGCGHPIFQEALRNLLCEPAFLEVYRLLSFSVPGKNPPEYLFLFVRSDYVYVLKEKGIKYTMFENK